MDNIPDEPMDGADIDDAVASRNDTRDSLFLMADVRIAGEPGSQQVRVRNLSTGGLMAEYAHGLEQGLAVELSVRGIGWIKGHVAWCAAGRVGVAFDRQIDPLLARKPVGNSSNRSEPVYFKPIMPRRRIR